MKTKEILEKLLEWIDQKDCNIENDLINSLELNYL